MRGRRIITRVLVFLLLGAIVNISVAWGCTMWSPLTGDPVRTTGPWPAPVGAEWPDLANILTKTGIGVRESQADGWLRAAPPKFGFTSQWSFSAGWPCYSMFTARCALNDAPQSGFVPIQATAPVNLKEGLATNPGDGILKLRPDRFLPTRPLWTGFVINTTCFAGILWLGVMMPRVWRRTLRIWHRQCRACGYQIAEGTGSVCSECGAALPAAWSTKTS